MPFCPYCGEEINTLTLKCYAVYVEHYEARINEHGKLVTEIEESEYLYDYDEEKPSFMCPLCGEELFDNYEDAEKFLKGELDAQIKAMKNLREEE